MTDSQLELKVYQTLMSEHGNNTHAALLDLCARFVRVTQGVSPGYMRWAPDEPSPQKIDVPPNPITDEWIATGVDA